MQWGLYGEHRHALDGKNRLFIPAKLRGTFQEDGMLVLSKGLDGCLFLYTREEWQSLEAKTKSLPLTGRDARAFTRYLFSGASLCAIDTQGRIPLPQTLKEYAHINRDVVIIGVSNRIEIWAKEKWQEYSKQTENVEDIAAKLEGFGI